VIEISIHDSSTAAAGSGRICAVAARAQRDAWKWTRRYGGMFGGEPFDSALLNSVCLASAFSAPWLTSAELRVTNRAALWSLAVASRSDVRTARCPAVADGAPGDDDLTRSLADIRDELAPMPAFPALRHVWREELPRLMEERASDGFCLVSHWISTADRAPSESVIPAIRDAVREARATDGLRAEHPRLVRYLESRAEFWAAFSGGGP
jgi:hypothetical protein